MEKVRVFERKCLRSCTSIHRSSRSNFLHYTSNKKLYNAAKISRIDNFIIHLIRDHILRTFDCYENNLIQAPYYSSEDYIKETLLNGFVPPEAFLYLDRNRYIQNNVGVPVLYHIYRRANDKRITTNDITTDNIRFDTNFYMEDNNIIPNLNFQKYWWLNN